MAESDLSADYSKCIEVEELPFHVIKMLETRFARFGIPEVFRTDNGACYKSESFFAFMESWGVVHKTSSPIYPEVTGWQRGQLKR